VLNSPTFLLATGLPGGLLLGSRFATNSVLVGGEPNEWEIFGRWTTSRPDGGHAWNLGLQLSRNGPARSTDGEAVLTWAGGPIRLLAGVRAFSSFGGGDGEVGTMSGVVVRLHPHVAIAGDVAKLVTLDESDPAWSVGLQLEIPYTPHSLSIHLADANTTTLQGSSVGTGDPRWGFEFTVPVRLGRYFGRRGGGNPEQGGPGTVPGGDPVTVEMDNRLRYLPDTVRIPVGATVQWFNASDLIHTVTADPEKALRRESVRLPESAATFDSGDLRPGEAFTYTFTVPGEYRYFCVPHEVAGMVGVVLVSGAREGGDAPPSRR
jgi:plastocyanin